MKHLTILQRLMLILLTLSLALAGVVMTQMATLRESIMAERETRARFLVDSARSVIAGFDARVGAGELTLAQAWQEAFAVLRTMH